MKRFWMVVLLCFPAFGQTTYKPGKSSGAITYSAQGQLVLGQGENTYCPATASGELTEGTPLWGASDGVANLPTSCMNTAVASTPSGTHIGGGGATTWTPANGPALTSLLNGGSLACGDTIQLAAGQVYIDSWTFTFPAPACDGGHWITVKSSGVSNVNFPGEGSRATPCVIGLANDATNGRQVPGYPDYSCPSYPTVLTARIQAPAAPGQSAVAFAQGANHYRFIGIEVTKSPGYRPGQLIALAADGVTLGSNHIIWDRSVVHGVPWTPAGDMYTETQSGVAAKNSQWVALINSWNYDTYCNSSCVDSQGFNGGTGTYQDGPFKLYNNLIATAGESYMLGGGGQGVGTPNTHHFEVRANHFFKPLIWMLPIETCTVFYNFPVTKNLGEFKNSVLALLEGNVYENNWQGCQSDQTGIAQIIAPKNQNNKASMVVTFNGTSTVTRVSGSPFLHQCGNNPNCSPADAANCPPGGCVLEINDASRGGVDNGEDYRFCNGSNGCTQTGDLVTTASLTTTVPTGSSISTYACVPGDCPSCRIQHMTMRFNEIMNVIEGVTIDSGKSSHCQDEAAGNDHIMIRDNLMHGLSIEMSNGSDPYASSPGFKIGSGQIGAVLNNVEIAHNTVAIETGGGSGGGLGSQIDYTDTKQFAGFNLHDNISPGPYQINHTSGSNVTKGYGGNYGLAYTFVTDTCAATFPNDAGGDIDFTGTALRDIAAGTAFTFSPSVASYLVTVDGQQQTITNSTSTGFTLSVAMSAGDAITIRNLAQCAWSFKGNLIGTSLPGSANDNSPYPDGTILASANNNLSCGRGTDACILDGASFTSLFANWQTRSGGDYTITNAFYKNSATDAASRPATGKDPGTDLTTMTQIVQGVRGATYYPPLSITTSALPGGTVGTAYNGFLQASAGASPYKGWWLETDPTKCGGNCGTLPAGIVIGRSGTVNGPFILLNVSRAVVACGSAGTVACSTFTLKQTLVAGALQVGQIVTIANLENGTGSQTNDATFNGTCTIRVVSGSSKFSCEQTGTGADTIPSHSPNSWWTGPYNSNTTYATGEQVVYGLVAYSSLQSGNKNHQPDTSPTYWQVYTLPANNAPGAVASFAPMTSGAFTFWVGARDGAFQLARAAITLAVAGQGADAHSVDLTWDASLGADSYNIYRGNFAGGPYTKQNDSPVVPTAWTDPAVLSGTFYYYVATSQNAGGESGYSNEAAVAVP